MNGSNAQIAVVGDLHSAWDDEDVAYFSRAPHDLLLFTGDLGASTRRDGVRIAKSISRIRREVLIMPGNNDVSQYGTLAAELAYRRGLRTLMGGLGDQSDGRAHAPGAAGQVRCCGYSAHRYTIGTRALTVIAGRPFSMGGPELAFSAELSREFGVGTLAESEARLRSLIDGAATEDLLILSHNGPRGLGDTPDAPWGNDFAADGGDWGDPDLTAAIAHARASGRRVLAVIAGHMHTPLRDGGRRLWQVRRDGTLYVNPAQVPRIFEDAQGRIIRHHVTLTLTDTDIEAQAILTKG